MYCGSCLHDNTLAASLLAQGHDVTLVPTYTPIRTDETDVSIDRLFYGAISVYLEQKSALYRRAPRWVDRLVGGPRLVSWLVRRGAATDARMLGELTLSVLAGEQGKQSRELARLVSWLRDSLRPELVHLTNSMFLGLAGPIRRQLDVPVLCSLQGEDLFLDGLVEPYRDQVRALLRERAADADGFVVNSRFYAELMADYLSVPPGKIHIVKLGLNLAGHGPARAPGEGQPFVIGYLARICPEKGLHVLVDAFERLAKVAGPDRVRLRIAGYLGPRDQRYFDDLMAQVRARGLSDAVEYLGQVDRAGKIGFLGSLHVLSVPAVYREPKGLYVLEALANGVPVVQPRHGAFPEMIEATGGGLLVEPDSPIALEQGLRELMENRERREALGRAGREAVHRDWGAEQMAEETVELYQAFLRRSVVRGAGVSGSP